MCLPGEVIIGRSARNCMMGDVSSQVNLSVIIKHVPIRISRFIINSMSNVQAITGGAGGGRPDNGQV